MSVPHKRIHLDIHFPRLHPVLSAAFPIPCTPLLPFISLMTCLSSAIIPFRSVLYLLPVLELAASYCLVLEMQPGLSSHCRDCRVTTGTSLRAALLRKLGSTSFTMTRDFSSPQRPKLLRGKFIPIQNVQGTLSLGMVGPCLEPCGAIPPHTYNP